MSQTEDNLLQMLEIVRTSDRAKSHRLAMEWPSLAAALAQVMLDYGIPTPGPLRHARNVISQEGGKHG